MSDKEAAEECRDEIEEVVKGAEMVFITPVWRGTGNGVCFCCGRSCEKKDGSLVIAVALNHLD